MRRFLVSTVLGLVLVACARETPAVPIDIQSFSFGDPAVVSVGQEVVITNLDADTHTWTSADGLFDSGDLTRGSTFSYTFETPGEYRFFCTIHPTMIGRVTVNP